MSVNKILARDRELREHATARPWHQAGQGIRLRLVGPLPRATIVVDPYGPNPQDAPLLLHRINTYEELEREIERLRATLRDARARLDYARGHSTGPLNRACVRVAGQRSRSAHQRGSRRPPSWRPDGGSQRC